MEDTLELEAEDVPNIESLSTLQMFVRTHDNLWTCDSGRENVSHHPYVSMYDARS